MNLDIDYLIKFYKNNTKSVDKEEFVEQDAPSAGATSTAPSGGSGKSPKKWESGRKFGKTYMNDPKYVWNSDIQRGHANSLFY